MYSGTFAVNKDHCLTKDTEKAYTHNEGPNTEHQPVTSAYDLELPKLLEIVLGLQQKVATIEKELTVVKQDNNALHTRLEALTNDVQPRESLDLDTQRQPVIPVSSTITTDGSLRTGDTSSSSGSSGDGSSSDEDSVFQPPARYLKKIKRLENRLNMLQPPTSQDSNQPSKANFTKAVGPRQTTRTGGTTTGRNNPVTTNKDLYVGRVSGSNGPRS
jgi:hypothetical protein